MLKRCGASLETREVGELHLALADQVRDVGRDHLSPEARQSPPQAACLPWQARRSPSPAALEGHRAGRTFAGRARPDLGPAQDLLAHARAGQCRPQVAYYCARTPRIDPGRPSSSARAAASARPKTQPEPEIALPEPRRPRGRLVRWRGWVFRGCVRPLPSIPPRAKGQVRSSSYCRRSSPSNRRIVRSARENPIDLTVGFVLAEHGTAPRQQDFFGWSLRFVIGASQAIAQPVLLELEDHPERTEARFFGRLPVRNTCQILRRVSPTQNVPKQRIADRIEEPGLASPIVGGDNSDPGSSPELDSLFALEWREVNDRQRVQAEHQPGRLSDT